MDQADIAFFQMRLIRDVKSKGAMKVGLALLTHCCQLNTCRIDQLFYDDILDITGYSSKAYINKALNELRDTGLLNFNNHSVNGISIEFIYPKKRKKLKIRRTGGIKP